MQKQMKSKKWNKGFCLKKKGRNKKTNRKGRKY